MNKLNKTLIAILLVLCVGLVGLTIAYFSNSTSIENEFKTNPYGTTVDEEFTSPSNWLPGDTTDKTITVTNSGEVDEAVRISLSETWTPNDSNETLTGWIHADGTKSNHTTENELSTDVRAAIINFTNNSDWTKVGDYYYYNYRLAPGQTTDSLIESVTFNALTKLGDTCTPSTSNGVTTITCNSSGDDYDNATYKLTVNIETIQYDKYKTAWGTNVNIASMKPMNASQLALKSNPVSVTNYTDGNVHEMYTFNHEATEQTPALTDYRYIGNDPYNYVYFNCDSLDNQNSDTCEVWRIIGVFDVERTDPNDSTKTITERRMKLVRGSALEETMIFDSNHTNYWVTSSLRKYLNETYYSSLSPSSQSQIDDSIYYLGRAISDTEPYWGSTEKLYADERGTKVCRNCSRLTLSEGKVGLLYPSDYGYTYSKGVQDNCYNGPNNCNIYYEDRPTKGWIYNSNVLQYGNDISNIYLITPTDDRVYEMYIVHTGSLGSTCESIGVRPTLYLSSQVKIIEGTGESTNPYKLGL